MAEEIAGGVKEGGVVERMNCCGGLLAIELTSLTCMTGIRALLALVPVANTLQNGKKGRVRKRERTENK